MKIDRHSVLAAAGDVRYRAVGDEMVLVRQQAAEVLGLNELGGRLFDLLDGKASIAALVGHLADDYEVERGRLEADVCAFFARLHAVGVVVVVDRAEVGD